MNRPTGGIATDGAHSSKNGLTRFRGIDLKTGAEIFIEHIGNKTVNIGEFLGVVEAVRYIIENDYQPRIIYTDSITAITWFRERKSASRKKSSALLKAEVYLKAMAIEVDRIEVFHWDNDKWGETPADFNEKR